MSAKRLAAHIIGTLLVVTACHKRAPVEPLPRVVALPAPPEVTFPLPRVEALPEPKVVVPPPVAPSPAAAALEQADRSFSAGAYDEAARAYENYLRLVPPNRPYDQELFRLGLSYVLRRNPNPDWRRATVVLKQLAREYPNSSFTAPANLILDLRSKLNHLAADTAANTKQRDERIRQLSSELDRLKKIDSDRRKRPDATNRGQLGETKPASGQPLQLPQQ
jgi:hypothetical protein